MCREEPGSRASQPPHSQCAELRVTGTISDIKRFAVHDGPGIRTTLFMKGCPLSCLWCHNPESLDSKPILSYIDKLCVVCGACAAACPRGCHVFGGGDKPADENEPAGDKAPTGNLTAPDASPVLHHIERRMCDCCGACVVACMPGALRIFGEKITAERAAELLLEDADFYEQSGGGATFSGGEPLLQADFCAAVMRILKENGTHIAVDTCGDVPWAAFQTVLPYTDMFLFDLKYVDADKLATWTGGSVGRIVGNLRALAARGALCEIRIPVIPAFNDDDAALLAMGRLAASMPNIT